MNAVIIGVLVMLVLSLARVHVVLSLVVGAFAGGLAAGLPLADVNDAAGNVVTQGVMSHFQAGLANGANIALSYAMLGAFAMAITHSGLPQQMAGAIIRRLDKGRNDKIPPRINLLKWVLIGGIVLMAVSSQNIVPIHIAFIPMMIPPLLGVFNRLRIDRRLIACAITFGLVTTYMFLPYGFGAVFLNKILLANVEKSGMDVHGINVMHAMAIPALGMVAGIAILVCFAIQLIYKDALLLGAMLGFAVFMMLGVVQRKEADSVFNQGIRMMAMVGFIMIAAQGFAEVMNATGEIKPLVDASASMFAGSKAMAAFAMLMVGLLVTMGIGSSFSTLPIITSIYVPLCVGLGFSPLATVAIIGTAGALGDAGSPASDSTLGPTMGLDADGQHNHMRDSVIPTLIHYNIPLFIAGWIAAMVL